ncbi:uncharacterized protein A4U43_C09F2390 [Asparagus officinalis]|uniref:Uncharacterized protein n=1 Tax=Asparagus officinalis TaxID=4686 RepID=A0A5P1E4P3_ASPOF|nr:uncharacterized protein A4U43_C09F2390 [Asparagus officinalis]
MGLQHLAKLQIHHQGSPHPPGHNKVLRPQPLQARLEISIRSSNHRHLNAAAVLQRRRRPARCSWVLAVDGLLPRRDVHCAEESAQVEHEMGFLEDAEPCLLGGFHCSGVRIDRRGCF